MRTQINLGDVVRDTISGFQGVAVCISDWLNGCRRIVVAPQELRDGKPIDNQIFDTEQLTIVTQAAKRATAPSGGDRDDTAARSRN